MHQPQTRKLSAILFADIVGYTALMQTNEQQALSSLQKFKKELETQVPTHQGKIANFYGDGCLAVFNSSLDAMKCAQSLQATFQSEPKVPVRIGLHAGDVVFRDENVFGDAVNIASRVESMGVPGAILLSSNVRNQIKNKPEFELVSLGRFEFKNVKEGMTVYALGNEGFLVPERKAMKGKLKSKVYSPMSKGVWISLLLFIVISIGIALLIPFFSKEKVKTEAKGISKEKPSIALLQFEDGSPDKNLTYLGFGLKEELLTTLIKLQKLDIVSTSLIEATQNDSKDPQEIGENLQVKYVLSGSVRANENTIRFNVRLLDVENQSFIWAHNAESPRSEMLQLQKDFAEAIAKNLPIELTETDLDIIQKTEVDPRAYELYLKGAYQSTFLESDAYKSITYLLESIAIEPDFALAYAHLAANEAAIAEFGSEPPIPHWMKTHRYVDKALALDSLNAMALGVKGRIQSSFEWDFLAAEITLKKAFALSPEQKFHYAFFLAFSGRNEELLECIEDYKNDNSPLVAQLFILGGNMDTAEHILFRLKKQLSTNWHVGWTFGLFYLYQKEYYEAISHLEQSVSLSQTNLLPLMYLGFAYGKAGKETEAKKILKQFSNMEKSRYVPSVCFGVVHVGLGNLDMAFKAFNKSFENRDFYLRSIMMGNIFYDPLIQKDPRYRNLLNKMNLGHLPPRINEKPIN